MEEAKKINLLVTMVTALLMVIILLIFLSISETKLTGKSVYDKQYTERQITYFSKCLAEKNVRLFCFDSSQNCKAQKSMFGASFAELNYVNCGDPNQVEKCAGLVVYPTWIINGQVVYGSVSLEVLAKLSECDL